MDSWWCFTKCVKKVEVKTKHVRSRLRHKVLCMCKLSRDEPRSKNSYPPNMPKMIGKFPGEKCFSNVPAAVIDKVRWNKAESTFIEVFVLLMIQYWRLNYCFLLWLGIFDWWCVGWGCFVIFGESWNWQLWKYIGFWITASLLQYFTMK